MNTTYDTELDAQRVVLNIVVLIEDGFAKSPTPDTTRALHRDVEALIVRHGHRCGKVSDAQLAERGFDDGLSLTSVTARRAVK